MTNNIDKATLPILCSSIYDSLIKLEKQNVWAPSWRASLTRSDKLAWKKAKKKVKTNKFVLTLVCEESRVNIELAANGLINRRCLIMWLIFDNSKVKSKPLLRKSWHGSWLPVSNIT